MGNIFKSDYVLLDFEVKSRTELFERIASKALLSKIVINDQQLIDAFEAREALDSTAFEDGFAIPHARFPGALEPTVYFVRLSKPIMWNNQTKKMTDVAIMLIIPEDSNDEYLDILSGVAQKLMDEPTRKVLKTSIDTSEIVEVLTKKQEAKESVVSNAKNTLKVVGVSACATGVVHTYMARDAILDAGKKLNWTVSVETQGQKGPEFKLTSAEIEAADAVILAVDIAIDLERFAGKKVYKVGTKTLIDDPQTQLRYAVSKGKELKLNGSSSFETKQQKAWIGHIMSGVSYMIPFIVFAGIIFAVVTGVGKIVWGTWLDYSGTFADGKYIQTGINSHFYNANFMVIDPNDGTTYIATIHSYAIAIFYYLNKFAGIGFSVMIPIMGAYIAYSIAGRAAIAPAFVLTMLGTTPDSWMKWGPFASMADNFPKNGGGIFAAIFFGFVIGYTIKWINTKWRINKFVQPIMPIIIIPVFVSLIFGLVTLLLIGNIFGILIGYVNKGLQDLEGTSVGMALLGLILGLLAGVDMGGPINKIASFGATALIFTDGGKAMGTAATAFAIAPMGAGIATFIFRKRFADDKALGINATILGFMGISEGAIPFAVKYRWAAIIPNIIASGIAAMFAGIFQVSGWVGAWGGPIIALFGGVTNWDMSYIGILWYFIAIAIGISVHIAMFRSLVYLQDNAIKVGSVKETHLKTIETTTKVFKNNLNELQSKIISLKNEKFDQIKKAKNDGLDFNDVKTKYDDLISNTKVEIKTLKDNHKDIIQKLNQSYKISALAEKTFLKTESVEIKTFRLQTRIERNEETKALQINTNNQEQTKYQIRKEKAHLEETKSAIQNKYILQNDNYQINLHKEFVSQYHQLIN